MFLKLTATIRYWYFCSVMCHVQGTNSIDLEGMFNYYPNSLEGIMKNVVSLAGTQPTTSIQNSVLLQALISVAKDNI